MKRRGEGEGLEPRQRLCIGAWENRIAGISATDLGTGNVIVVGAM